MSNESPVAEETKQSDKHTRIPVISNSCGIMPAETLSGWAAAESLATICPSVLTDNMKEWKGTYDEACKTMNEVYVGFHKNFHLWTLPLFAQHSKMEAFRWVQTISFDWLGRPTLMMFSRHPIIKMYDEETISDVHIAAGYETYGQTTITRLQAEHKMTPHIEAWLAVRDFLKPFQPELLIRVFGYFTMVEVTRDSIFIQPYIPQEIIFKTASTEERVTTRKQLVENELSYQQKIVPKLRERLDPFSE